MSRYTNPTPIQCSECGWRGQIADCQHEYRPVGRDDIEPIDLCPKCGSEDLWEIGTDFAELIPVPG